MPDLGRFFADEKFFLAKLQGYSIIKGEGYE
jgi:hypothetical protein